jgi:hypothetical protein
MRYKEINQLNEVRNGLFESVIPASNDVMKQITGLSPADQQKLVQYLKQDLAQAAA